MSGNDTSTRLEQFVDNHDSVEDIFSGPEHDTVLGAVKYWLQWGVVGKEVLCRDGGGVKYTSLDPQLETRLGSNPEACAPAGICQWPRAGRWGRGIRAS
jgi:hypothetical protein